MNRYLWTLLTLALLTFTVACGGGKTVETEPMPAPVVEEPQETEPIPEEVTPVVVEEEPQDMMEIDLDHIRLDDVYFDFDKSDLREDTLSTLERHVMVLKANPKVRVLIEGHCDERGTEEYNIALGERRAERVRAFLVGSGIDASRLRTISYGEMRPKDPGHNEEAWALNRRAHFVLSLAD